MGRGGFCTCSISFFARCEEGRGKGASTLFILLKVTKFVMDMGDGTTRLIFKIAIDRIS